MTTSRSEILGALLQSANSHPPVLAKGDFYRLKDRILRRYGELVRHDLQHIKKPCWGCNGTGTFTGCDNGWSWVECPPTPCLRCGATGVYSEFWTVLEVWRLGGRHFHRPLFRTHNEQDPRLVHFASGLLFDDGRRIEGYIEHKPHRHAAEAAYILALLFDRPLFWRLWGSCGHRRKHTPLAWTGSVAFWFRYKIRSVRSAWVNREKINREGGADDIPF